MSVTTTRTMRDGLLAMLRTTTQISPWADVLAVWELDEPAGSLYVTDAVESREASVGSATLGATGRRGYGATMTGAITYQDGFDELTGDFTVTFWTFFPSDGSDPSTTVLFFGSDVKVDLDGGQVRYKESNVTVAATNSGATKGAWEHWAIRRTGTQIAIYKNGAITALATDTPSAATITSESFVMFGSSVTVDQYAVFSVAKSGTDIASIYNSGVGLEYRSRILAAPYGPFQDIEMGPFTPNDDPETILERMSGLAPRMPGLFLSQFPISTSVGSEARPAPGRILSYDETWLLAAIFPSLRPEDAGSREDMVSEWRERVRLSLEQRFVTGVPATPQGWEFRFARFGPISGVWLPEAYVETVAVNVQADGACRTDV